MKFSTIILFLQLLLTCIQRKSAFILKYISPTKTVAKQSEVSGQGIRRIASPLFCERKRGLTANNIISENRRAGHDYEFDETFVAGIVLLGTEVKSCRKGTVQISDGLAEIRDGECWLLNVHIAEYGRTGYRDQHTPKRIRKLLLSNREILKLEQRVLQQNYEIIPTKMYFSDKNFVKIELGVGKQKALGDKRDDMIKRDGEREIRRVMKGGYD